MPIDVSTLGIEIQSADAEKKLSTLKEQLAALGVQAKTTEVATANVSKVLSGQSGILAHLVGGYASLSGSIFGASSALRSLPFTAAAGGALALGIALREIISSLEEMQDSERRLQTALMDTDGSWAISLSQLNKMAEGYANLSGVAISKIREMESQAAGMPHIGDAILSKLIRTSLDVAAAKGEDATEVFHKLAIAMDDPANSLMRLHRAGIGFDSSLKDQVKTLASLHENYEAQVTVLDNVDKRYKGMAATVGNDLSGSFGKLRNSISELIGALGSSGLTGLLTGIVSTLTVVISELSVMITTVFAILGTVGNITTIVMAAMVNDGVAVKKAIHNIAEEWKGVGTAQAEAAKKIETAMGLRDPSKDPDLDPQGLSKANRGGPVNLKTGNTHDPVAERIKNLNASTAQLNLETKALEKNGEERIKLLIVAREEDELIKLKLSRGSAQGQAVVAATDANEIAKANHARQESVNTMSREIEKLNAETKLLGTEGAAYRELAINQAVQAKVQEELDKGIIDRNGKIAASARQLEQAKLDNAAAKANDSAKTEIDKLTSENAVLNLNIGYTREQVLARRELQTQLDIQNQLEEKHLTLATEDGRQMASQIAQIDQLKFKNQDLQAAEQGSANETLRMGAAFNTAGDDIANAFETAVTGSKNLLDTFKNLGHELTKLVLQVTVFDKLKDALKVAVGENFKADGSGGGIQGMLSGIWGKIKQALGFGAAQAASGVPDKAAATTAGAASQAAATTAATTAAATTTASATTFAASVTAAGTSFAAQVNAAASSFAATVSASGGGSGGGIGSITSIFGSSPGAPTSGSGGLFGSGYNGGGFPTAALGMEVSAFSQARRYDMGGDVTAVPIIAHEGERVLTKKENREWKEGKSEGGGHTIHIGPIITKDADSFRPALGQIMSDAHRHAENARRRNG